MYKQILTQEMKNHSKNIQTVLDILRDEVRGDISSAREKMTDDYSMTWVYQKKNGELFPCSHVTEDSDLEDVYPIEGRKYEIFNLAEAGNTVLLS